MGSGGTTDVDPIVRRPPGPGLRAAAGNPFSLSGGAGASLELSLPVAGDAHVALYDARGRQVRVLVDGDEMPAGERTLRWDGRDDAGRTVETGLYFARAVTATGVGKRTSCQPQLDSPAKVAVASSPPASFQSVPVCAPVLDGCL